VAPGSMLVLMSDLGKEERQRQMVRNGLSEERLPNLRLVHEEGNSVLRKDLERVHAAHAFAFDSVLILSDQSLEANVQISDSRSLAALLLVRDIQDKFVERAREAELLLQADRLTGSPSAHRRSSSHDSARTRRAIRTSSHGTQLRPRLWYRADRLCAPLCVRQIRRPAGTTGSRPAARRRLFTAHCRI
jgi:hypothetical protein